jgi:hypothetical protein
MLFKKIKLLCITCPREDIPYPEQVELACMGGADLIQSERKVCQILIYSIFL